MVWKRRLYALSEISSGMRGIFGGEGGGEVVVIGMWGLREG